MLFSEEVKHIRESKTRNQLQDAEQKLKEINSKIIIASVAQSDTDKHTKKQLNSGNNDWDWTGSYAKYATYEDIEELQTAKKIEEDKITALGNLNDSLGHYHDHTKEREIFEKPETEKLKMCENNRIMGNYCYKEGMYARAAEKYQIAIAYYEYCFPDSDEEQQKLNRLRHACLCNIALCYTNLGLYRQAETSAQMVIRETKGTHAKAYFRRAVAYRYLDEYSKALSDLKQALELSPNDAKVIEEMKTVKALMEAYEHQQVAFAKQSLRVTSNNTDANAAADAAENGGSAGGAIGSTVFGSSSVLFKSDASSPTAFGDVELTADLSQGQNSVADVEVQVEDIEDEAYMLKLESLLQAMPLEPMMTPAIEAYGRRKWGFE